MSPRFTGDNATGCGFGCLAVIIILFFVNLFFRGVFIIVRWLLPVAVVLGVCYAAWYYFFRNRQ